MRNGFVTDEHGLTRCWWGAGEPLYSSYHDNEWGMSMIDDRLLFEKICLEGLQSGLSWLTILRKRNNFRKAFDAFDIRKVSRFGEGDVRRLLRDEGIVRHQGKIRSTINNAKRAVELTEEFGSLAAYFWSFEPKASARPKRLTYRALRTLTESRESKALSKDLKKRSWTFVGPTTAYAFMQAVGLVNDHVEGCHVREKCMAARADLDLTRFISTRGDGKSRA